VLLAPAATPAPVVDRLPWRDERIMAAPDMVKKVADLGLIPFDTQPVAEIRAYIRLRAGKMGLPGAHPRLAGSAIAIRPP